jgi:hypothetical protein
VIFCTTSTLFDALEQHSVCCSVRKKCEIVLNDENVVSSFRAVMPNVRHIPYVDAVLLGAPIGNESSRDTVLHSKLTIFQRLASRLKTLNAQDALFLLRNCFGMLNCFLSVWLAQLVKSLASSCVCSLMRVHAGVPWFNSRYRLGQPSLPSFRGR